MVRLKVCLRVAILKVRFLFQFHNGSIKSCPSINLLKAQCFGFNSTMVRLKATPYEKMLDLQVGFNSTMVRLKENTMIVRGQNSYRFNSTMVRLKEDGIPNKDASSLCFNSTMVRLKVSPPLDLMDFDFVVSIPQWFD